MAMQHNPHSLDGGIDYTVVEVNEPAHPYSRRLLAYWRERLRADGPMLRSDFNPLDLPQLMGGMFVVEPVDGGSDMRYRLVGSENERRLGRKFTGELFSQCYSQEMAAEQIAFHNRIMQSEKPAFLQGNFLGLDLEHVRYEAAYFPVRVDERDLQVIGGLYDMADGKAE
ncbi:PAS domain-containing protein [Parvibaculum sp.]|jgi:hypothetical protein|uniref:PAS domain-containing protein n=1 Tax=Parvibaculum sp. TaxID=2024848 RepID=UPI000C4B28E2|nr:PAS domain-containing protein [Parvibaculum sp.]HAC59330.1 hypothetical protein [Rhodobiaceae bacterium]MAU60254.1 hypothetical protein [Parvibaculum sp.]MBO6669466.1 PAS domain-containing protein [Parvibaculum sp.]MBO6692639.1 PAS domain-containing protein [Parvibaculum sp.]MBO6715852.1 PAS domain-containing protein [Parvibaculum sp.]|tara:strand:+ start:14147 stop:14653 length:507 start_codon:yes stop_codon:yes gene_type:complete